MTVHFDQHVGEIEQTAIYLNAVRHRFGKARSIEDARTLRTVIGGLERCFQGGCMTEQEVMAMEEAFLRGVGCGKR